MVTALLTVEALAAVAMLHMHIVVSADEVKKLGEEEDSKAWAVSLHPFQGENVGNYE